MGPVAAAIADALEQAGWDGKPDRIGGDVRSSSGTLYGEIDIVIRPRSTIIAADRMVAMTPTAFLKALRTSWSQPIVMREPPVEEKPAPRQPRRPWWHGLRGAFAR